LNNQSNMMHAWGIVVVVVVAKAKGQKSWQSFRSA
jgi:hypothetical protein